MNSVELKSVFVSEMVPVSIGHYRPNHLIDRHEVFSISISVAGSEILTPRFVESKIDHTFYTKKMSKLA